MIEKEGNRLKPEQVVKRYENAKSRKDLFEDLYREAYDYAIPQRQLYSYWEGGSVGQKKMQKVFDSTAIHSTQRFANRLQSGVFPPQRMWCRLEPGNTVPQELRSQVQAKLDEFRDIMFSVIRQSNFDIAIGEFLLDVAVGTGAMLVQPGDNGTPIEFTPVPLFLLCYEEGANGQIDKIYRRLRIKGETIQQQWRDAKLSENLQQKIMRRPSEEIELIEATMLDYERGDWCYHLIVHDQKEEIVYRRLNGNPWVISRYMKVAGEIYGRGPLLTAMPDIKTLNKTKQLLLQNATLAVMPAFTAQDDGVLNPHTIKIVPGSIIPVARNGGSQGESLKPLPRAGDFNVSQLVISDMRQNIKQILLDESLPPDNMSARSATEVVERMKELSQNLGSAFGRLINETMVPLVGRIMQVMNDRGLINMPLRVDGLQVKVQPISPLAQAQSMEEINAIVQYIQLTQPMGAEGEYAINKSALIDMLGDKLGVPSSVRHDATERAVLIQQRAQAEQAAAVAAAQQQMAMGQQPPPVVDQVPR